MELYIFLFILLGVTSIVKSDKQKYLFFLIGAFIIILGATRGMTVGTDVRVYYRNWAVMTNNQTTWNQFTPFEIGFNYYIMFLKNHISSSYYFFYGSVFVITWLLLLWYIYKVCYNKIFSVFCLYGTIYYFMTMNAMRQCLAFSLLLPFIYFYMIGKLKLLYYIIALSLIVILVHNSMAIFLLVPIALFLEKKEISSKLLYIILGVSVFLFFSLKNIPFLAALQTTSLLTTRYQGYVEYALKNEFEFSNLEMLLYVFFCAFTVYMTKSKKRDATFYIYFIGIVFRTGFISTFPFVSRFFYILCVFGAIYWSTFIKDLSNRKKVLFYMGMVAYLAVLFNHLVIGVNSGEVIPYINMFNL